ncbi:MAG: hypothetical protein EPO42_14515 [Gallionellaceae bacterium]|nr:MAG: hypothetical protein EPO42_14515 [Gallionellaceae bacterium]
MPLGYPAFMVPWDEVTVRVRELDSEVARGARVPGRIVALDLYRRTGRCEGVEVDVESGAIDWCGIEEAVAWLDAQDVHGPQVVRMPRA